MTEIQKEDVPAIRCYANLLSLSEFVTTLTVLKAMAAEANIGFIKPPALQRF